MFQHNQPVTPDLTITISNTHRTVNRMALRICACNPLDAVTESNVAITVMLRSVIAIFDVPLKCVKKPSRPCDIRQRLDAALAAQG